MASPPQTVAYCHCDDCRRWTGAPVGAFAAFDVEALRFDPPLSDPLVKTDSVARWNCPKCGSPLAATFDYLPGQVYVPLGVLDQIDDVQPELHCHADNCARWLRIQDTLPKYRHSGRSMLRKGS
ncbi:MAG: GFA family protein [Paracoccaceae bacterium]|nr:GFA family protein [Paracoccaceae bacterium]